jgi:hypothetical protein
LHGSVLLETSDRILHFAES